MSLIVREGLRDIVYKRLHEMIEDSRFVPGTRINVEQLTEEMGVSRTPIWQAVGKLEKEGLLVSVPNKGVFIKVLSPEESIDLYSVREVLECMAAELAAINMDSITITQMEQNLADQKEVIAAADLVAYGRLDAQFHAWVYKASNNNYLIDILGDIQKKMRPMVMHMNVILDDLFMDHNKLFTALKDRNPAAAREAFRNHNERMKTFIRQVAETRTA